MESNKSSGVDKEEMHGLCDQLQDLEGCKEPEAGGRGLTEPRPAALWGATPGTRGYLLETVVQEPQELHRGLEVGL